MNPILTILILSAACLSAQNLIPNPGGSKDFNGYFRTRGAAITSHDGIIQLSGVEADEKLNQYQKVQRSICNAAALIKPRSFVLSCKCRAKKLSGAVQIACREAFADNKSSKYHGFTFKRFDIPAQWTAFKMEFTTKEKSTDLSLYIVAYYLKDDDLVEFKDIQLEEIK